MRNSITIAIGNNWGSVNGNDISSNNGFVGEMLKEWIKEGTELELVIAIDNYTRITLKRVDNPKGIV